MADDEDSRDLQLALAHYRMMFKTVADLGAGADPALWKKEYDRVSASGFNAVLITSSSYEGGAGSGQKNFKQSILLEALHTRRAELDPTHDEVAFAPPSLTPRYRRMGYIARMGY